MASRELQDTVVPVRIKLAALWTSMMFCYVYGDYFELYVPGKLQEMLQGNFVLGPVTQWMLVGTAVLMAIPSLMVFLSVSLSPIVTRWLNVGAGLFYAAIMVAIFIGGAWAFYMLFAAIEVMLALLVVWHAWQWPQKPRAVV